MNFILISYPIQILLICLAVISLYYFLKRKYKITRRLWWIGAGGFIISQVLHIPFNWVIFRLGEKGVIPLLSDPRNIFIYIVFLGLSAGLFEELTRYAVFKWWAVDARKWRHSLALGAGHGGIEALLIVLIILLNFIYIIYLFYTQSPLLEVSGLLEITSNIKNFWSNLGYPMILAVIERLFVLVIQISLSVLVLQSFVTKKIYWLFIAIFWHALIDAVAVYLTIVYSELYRIELVIGVAALLSLGIIFYFRHSGIDSEPEELISGAAGRIVFDQHIEHKE